MAYFVYILKCADQTYYTGYTTNVEKRVETHNLGKGAKYTKARLPVTLVHFEEFEEKGAAMRREWEIKHKLDRKQKEALIFS